MQWCFKAGFRSWDRGLHGCRPFAVACGLRPPATLPAPTFLGELGKVLLQVRHTLPLQVTVKLEPGDRLFFREAGSGEQPTAADHLLQEPAACWQGDTGRGFETQRPYP